MANINPGGHLLKKLSRGPPEAATHKTSKL